MEKFTKLEAIAAPIMQINIDTDVIIPSREMKHVSKNGLSDGLFANWRYTKPGGRKLDPDFILNQKPYTKAKILFSGANFGCGSSREHAVWALYEWGIRAIIAPSFGDIFFGNCVRNGILPIVLENQAVLELANQIKNEEKNRIEIDLNKCVIRSPSNEYYSFNISASDRKMLLEGMDEIAVTQKRDDQIFAFQEKDILSRPWAYLEKN
ncbi:MAG: 3-isopropylmalate dehydratase small subunit [Pseudomonadota bacterium]|nr:3-isopropylmalate dehydratase small subunit [Pseudomonadota bacterium]